jgi:hypothetical protein
MAAVLARKVGLARCLLGGGGAEPGCEVSNSRTSGFIPAFVRLKPHVNEGTLNSKQKERHGLTIQTGRQV